MRSEILNNLRIFVFKNKKELVKYTINKKGLLIAVSGEKLTNKNKELKKIINNNYTITYPDGIGTVLALKRKGVKAVKIPGVELWLEILKENYKVKTIYLLGASREVITQTVNKIRKDFNGIKICGFRDGFFNNEDIPEILDEIKIKKPDIVLMALGTPRQELLMDKSYQNHEALYVGLGGSFDVYCGLKKRAPKIFINLGLEWLYRLLQEPKRYKRQLKLIRLLYKVLINKI